MRVSRVLAIGLLACGCPMAHGDEPSPARGAAPVAVRAESFTVPPSTRPVVFVDVKNLSDAPCESSVTMKGPEGWRIGPAKRDVSLRPGQLERVPFTIQEARNLKSNSYPVEVSATASGVTIVRKQNVVCASAPYFKPTIDGDPSDFKDAIPVTFAVGGRKTVVSTYWNRRQFSILVAVEEDKLVGYPRGSAPGRFDAVQLAIAPQDTVTGTSEDEQATRFEFLLVAGGEGAGDQGAEGKCFQLARPGMKLAEALKVRQLGPLQYEDAKVVVSRTGGVTYYECGIPFKPMREAIRPTEGREFFLSVLVHDPDGTGIRDLGQAAGLWPWQRNRLAWSRWQGAQWGPKPPFDSKLHWGFCTSKY